MKDSKAFLLAVALSLSFAIFTCFVSNNLWSRFEHRQDVITEQFSILKGEPYRFGNDTYYFPTFQNRVLFPYALKGISALGVLTVSKSYLLLRLFTAFLAFFTFFYLVAKTGRVTYKAAAVGMLALAYCLVFTFNHGFEHTTDFPDVLFTCLFLLAAICGWRWRALLFAVVASANRESCVFCGVIWFFANGFDERSRPKPAEIFYSAALSVISYESALLLRLALGGPKAAIFELPAGWPHIVARFRDFLLNPTNSSWPVLLAAMAIPLILWLWSNRKTFSALHKRLLMASAAIVLVTQQFARLDELRVIIPAIVVAVYVATAAESGILNKDE